MGLVQYVTIFLLYSVAILQGMAFVIFPSASIILTSPMYHHLTPNEYGSLFIPMIISAIVVSGAGGSFAKRHGIRKLFLPGIICNILSMTALAGTEGTLEWHYTSYLILLSGTLMLGAGFGACITSLNALIINLFPKKSATALTALHAVLGIGTAIGPTAIQTFNEIEKWWLAPFAIAVGLACLFFLILLFSDLGTASDDNVEEKQKVHQRPKLLWLFLAITFCYGICETIIGVWSPIYLNQVKGVSEMMAIEGLSRFWLMVTVGRIFTSVMTNWISFRCFYFVLPLLVIGAFLGIPEITSPESNLQMMAIAGLACSALLPLSISFAEQSFPNYKEVVSGSLISSYMTGYGIAAYGTGGRTK